MAVNRSVVADPDKVANVWHNTYNECILTLLTCE